MLWTSLYTCPLKHLWLLSLVNADFQIVLLSQLAPSSSFLFIHSVEFKLMDRNITSGNESQFE